MEDHLANTTIETLPSMPCLAQLEVMLLYLDKLAQQEDTNLNLLDPLASEGLMDIPHSQAFLMAREPALVLVLEGLLYPQMVEDTTMETLEPVQDLVLVEMEATTMQALVENPAPTEMAITTVLVPVEDRDPVADLDQLEMVDTMEDPDLMAMEVIMEGLGLMEDPDQTVMEVTMADLDPTAVVATMEDPVLMAMEVIMADRVPMAVAETADTMADQDQLARQAAMVVNATTLAPMEVLQEEASSHRPVALLL